MDIRPQLLSGNQRFLHGLFTARLRRDLLFEDRRLLSQPDILPHDLLETFGGDLQEDIDLLGVVSPEDLLEIATLVTNVERCQVDHVELLLKPLTAI